MSKPSLYTRERACALVNMSPESRAKNIKSSSPYVIESLSDHSRAPRGTPHVVLFAAAFCGLPLGAAFVQIPLIGTQQNDQPDRPGLNVTIDA